MWIGTILLALVVIIGPFVFLANRREDPAPPGADAARQALTPRFPERYARVGSRNRMQGVKLDSGL
ncbi:hypothetical protein [Thermosporothrix hazakensis]|uniref:Uncharacterized protein n=1 Tax=Thermosporothrix sp. COM3 TaxID=2490863 RepID=A0A455SDX2_9CHLR|nr:hypothetical protein [Thermosporothrix hazakensis]BBH85700.1 hypothetical protein KTC_04510 [Thermosporothrix sp. COM3]GCE45871.1 hypothetical protein KTH_07400 [Thermosporothrix hazakensis]